MARVLAVLPDLLFGSRVQADLSAAGHQVEVVGTAEQAHARAGDAEVLIVDLTDEHLNGPQLIERVARDGDRRVPRTLGFYSHVDAATRERAESAGFNLVVPRSRMAREGASLVERLAKGG